MAEEVSIKVKIDDKGAFKKVSVDAENGDVVVQMPSVVYGKRQRGGQPGNTNARKCWRKEGK